MNESSALIANERQKGSAGIAFNLATALIAATAARGYVEPQFDPLLILWSVGAVALMWVGWSILSLLETEA